jgi:hypothetical protein
LEKKQVTEVQPKHRELLLTLEQLGYPNRARNKMRKIPHYLPFLQREIFK